MNLMYATRRPDTGQVNVHIVRDGMETIEPVSDSQMLRLMEVFINALQHTESPPKHNNRRGTI